MNLRTLAAVVACALSGAATASADVIVVPPELEGTQGGFGGTAPFAFPTTTGLRTQISYDASLFGAGERLITAIEFRPIDPTGGFFGDTLNVSDARLQLSTTGRSDESRNPLSGTFADNVGADARTVYSGPLSLTTHSTLLPNGTRAFDYVITLQTPFVYDPAAGNLLLDTLVLPGQTVRGNAFFGSFPRFDTANANNDGVYSVLNNSDGAATTGTVGTSGPVTRFVTEPVAAPVPAPASLFLATIAGAALLLRRKLLPAPARGAAVLESGAR